MTNFNQQKVGVITHYTLEISFCFHTIELLRKLNESLGQSGSSKSS